MVNTGSLFILEQLNYDACRSTLVHVMIKGFFFSVRESLQHTIPLCFK